MANHLCKVFTKTTLRTPCNVYLPHRVSRTPDKVTLCNLCTQQMLYAPSTTYKRPQGPRNPQTGGPRRSITLDKEIGNQLASG